MGPVCVVQYKELVSIKEKAGFISKIKKSYTTSAVRNLATRAQPVFSIF